MKTSTIKSYLLENAEELKSVVRELNSWNSSLDHLDVYENDEEFFEIYFEGKPLEAVRATQFGEYSFTDDLVQFNGYGNLDSFSYNEYEEKLVEYIDEIVDCLEAEKDNVYLSPELEELLNEDEESEEN